MPHTDHATYNASGVMTDALICHAVNSPFISGKSCEDRPGSRPMTRAATVLPCRIRRGLRMYGACCFAQCLLLALNLHPQTVISA
jgi:hypothetical protein